MNNKTVGLAICGSFCTHSKILEAIKDLKSQNYNVIPIFTPITLELDTRFGNAKDFFDEVVKLCENSPVTTISQAEQLGPKGIMDILVVAPCTGNTLAKLAHAVTDNAVTMITKAHLRNNKPVVIGVSTNDGLGLSFNNLSLLINSKNFYFVPFGQDDCKNKPKSLVCQLDLLVPTIEKALAGEQLQPVIVNY